MTEFTAEDPFFRGCVEALEDCGDAEAVEALALTREVRDQSVGLVSESSRLSDELQVLAMNVEEPTRLADLVASNLELDISGKQAFLEELDVVARLHRVRDELRRAGDAIQIESEIREKVQSEMGKTQREYMLRQQLDHIRKELGEAEDEDAEADALRSKIDAARMPEEAEKQALRELERLEQMPPASAEHGVIRAYLEWMVDLPWSETSEDQLSVEDARRILDEDHFGLEKVKGGIVEYMDRKSGEVEKISIDDAIQRVQERVAALG
ncbi:MAG: hypothetical protein GY946_15175 [bacterium]|nr:hypothetical protein [bacterium]